MFACGRGNVNNKLRPKKFLSSYFRTGVQLPSAPPRRSTLRTVQESRFRKKLIEVLNRNLGGGWDSLSQSIQDIIQSGFDISTTTLPKDRLKKKGGMYEKKIEDGFEVLEIPKGSWVEAIFAKEKPLVEKPRLKFGVDDEDEDLDSEENEDEDAPEIEDTYGKPDEDDDDYDEDRLTEESYRTTYEENPEDLSLDAVDASDDDDY